MIFNRHTAFRVPLFGILLFVTTPAFDEVDIQQLPRDEKEAQALLSEGALDSALWRRVEPFYTTPLCVPAGELRILLDLFVSLPDNLPTTAGALSEYFPWDAAAQDRLFADFPELLPFKPILSFEQEGAGTSSGKMAFCFSRPQGSDTMKQYALFSTGTDRSILRAEGRVDFTNDFGRWYRRTVVAVPHPGFQATFGNFDVDHGSRLFYGYFPAMDKVDTSLENNWLYGTYRSWNGMLVSIDDGQARKSGKTSVAGTAFVHTGSGERMAYGESTVKIANQVSFTGGFSALETVDTAERRSENDYFHCGVTAMFLGSNQCEVHTGMDLRRPLLVPFDLIWRHHGEKSRLRASFTDLPNGFYAPRSALVHYVAGKAGMADTIKGHATAVDVQFTHLQSTAFTWTPRISAVFSGDDLRFLETEIGASGSMAFVRSYRVDCKWSPLFRADGQTAMKLQGLCECTVPLGRLVCITMSNRYSSLSDGYWRYTGTLTPQFEFGRVARIAPLFALSSASTQSFEKTAGIQQVLRFSDKTYSEIKIEKQFPDSNGGSVSALGRMSFVF